MPEAKKKKRCPICSTDMEVGGVCPNEDCEFNDTTAEREARGRAYLEDRTAEIREENKKARAQEGKKRGGIFGR